MKNLLVRFRAFCVSSFPLVAFALVLSNFIVSCSVSRSVKPQYFYKTEVVTNYIHSVVTNFVTGVTSSTIVSTSTNGVSSSSYEPPVYDYSYRYFVLSARRMAYMDGAYLSEGDICSRGLILRIFPDRIFLHDGSVIQNTYRKSLDESFNPVSASYLPLPKKKRGSHDR